MQEAGKLADATRGIKNLDKRLSETSRERDDLARAGGGDLATASKPALQALEAQAILELQGEVTRANKARNRAMVAVWTITERHHSEAGEKCSCGKPLHACAEYNGLDFIRSE